MLIFFSLQVDRDINLGERIGNNDGQFALGEISGIFFRDLQLMKPTES
jgi:hypothetical protein